MSEPKKRVGAPKKYLKDPFIQATLIECFENGFTLIRAAEAAGIDYLSYNKWVKEDAEFAARMQAAQMVYKQAVKERVIARVKKLQEHVDDLIFGRCKTTKTTITRDNDDKIMMVVTVEETEHPPKWLIERYLPVDIEPEEAQENITLTVNFSDDSPVDAPESLQDEQEGHEDDD
jgi:hypothetical protein